MVVTKSHDDVIDMIVGLDSQQILDFRPSEGAQERVDELFAKSSAGTLSPDERAELESVVQLDYVMRMAKIRALQRLRSAQK
jgi:hypothetical protein